MLLLFQATATQVADSTQVAADKLMEEAIANADGLINYRSSPSNCWILSVPENVS